MRPNISRNDATTRQGPVHGRMPARETEVNRNYDFTSRATEATPNTHYDFCRNAVSPRITASDITQPLGAIQKTEAAALRKVVGQEHVIPELVRHIYQHVRRGLTLLEGQNADESGSASPPAILSGPSGVGKQTAVAAISDAFSLPLVALSTTESGSDDLTALADRAATALIAQGRDLYLEHHADPVATAHARGERAAIDSPLWPPQFEDLLNRQINSFCRFFGVLLATSTDTSAIDVSVLRAQVLDRLERSAGGDEGSTTLPPPNILVFVSTTASTERVSTSQLKSQVFSFHRLGRSHLETIAARRIDLLVQRLDDTAFPDLTRIGKIRIRRDCVGVIADHAIRHGTARAVQRTTEQLPALLSAHVRRSAVNGTSMEELEVTADLLRQLLRDPAGRGS